MVTGVVEVNVNVPAVRALRNFTTPVLAVRERNSVKLAADDLAVQTDTAVGAESAHTVLTVLYAYPVPAGVADSLLRDIPRYGLLSLLPVPCADRVVDDLARIRRRNVVVDIVIGRIERRIGLISGVLALYPEKPRRSLLRSDGGVHGSCILPVGRQLLRRIEPEAVQHELRSFRGECHLVAALFKVEYQRLSEKPVRVPERQRLPHLPLDLRRAHLISAAVLVYLLRILPYSPEGYARSSIERQSAVYLHRELDRLRSGAQTAVGHFSAVYAGLGNIEPVTHLAVRTLPLQHIFVSLTGSGIVTLRKSPLCGGMVSAPDGDGRACLRTSAVCVVIVAVRHQVGSGSVKRVIVLLYRLGSGGGDCIFSGIVCRKSLYRAA